MDKKLQDAHMRGKIEECARMLWIMDDERTRLRRGLEKVILVEAQRHAMQVKVKMAITIFETLKMRIMAGDKPPGGGRTTKENGYGQEERPDHEGSGSEPPSGV
jgi:hypothetical protein